MKKKLLEILTALGFATRVQAKETLTQTEWSQVVSAYREKYGTDLVDDIAKPEDSGNTTEDLTITQAQIDSIFALLGETQPEAVQVEHTTASLVTAVQNIVNERNQALNQMADMTRRPAADLPAAEGRVAMNINGPGTTATFLFGIDNPAFAMDKRWNKITANPSFAANPAPAFDDSITTDFYQSASAFAQSLARRYAYLNENHLLDQKALATGEFSTTYQGVTDAKVGDQYVIRRQDALIARVLAKRDLTQFFPVRYGIQDHDLVFNTFFAEISQAYQTGEVYKGGMSIENEMGHVDDLMIKMKWGPMKELERKYIGYLNKEGSDPIKWSMIEWAILNSLETAQVEQNKRRVRGIYYKPETGVAGNFLNGSTGLLYTLIRYIHENKLKLHDSSDYASYAESTMLTSVKAFVSDVLENLSEDMDLGQHVLYLNERHKTWWIANCRTTYGKDLDFTGPGSYLNIVPDTDLKIRWLPYLGSLPLMFMDIPGNLQFLEYIPGEMMAIKAKDDMELVKAWSTWKEGCAAAFTGKHFATKAAMDANNYAWQQIFMNKPIIALAKDATTADGANGFWFKTIANVGETAPAITDISNAKAGVAYIIECGSLTKPTTIAKALKFSLIIDDFEPTAVGDYLMVVLNSEGKFLELERCVGGTRTINSTLQPNLPGVR